MKKIKIDSDRMFREYRKVSKQFNYKQKMAFINYANNLCSNKINTDEANITFYKCDENGQTDMNKLFTVGDEDLIKMVFLYSLWGGNEKNIKIIYEKVEKRGHTFYGVKGFKK